MSSTDLAPRLERPRLRRSAALLIFASSASWVASALAQSCPEAHSACDNGGCCPSSDQCCPTLAEGCCSSSTPYCCGDGTCAASPSQCGDPFAAGCEGYDIPCGAGCAPAGADCCDSDGHYCPPESMCGSEATCLTGEDPTPALLVQPPAAPAVSQGRAASPVADPPNASERSCSLSGAPASGAPGRSRASGAGGWGAYWLGALFWLRRHAKGQLAAGGEQG